MVKLSVSLIVLKMYEAPQYCDALSYEINDKLTITLYFSIEKILSSSCLIGNNLSPCAMRMYVRDKNLKRIHKSCPTGLINGSLVESCINHIWNTRLVLHTCAFDISSTTTENFHFHP